MEERERRAFRARGFGLLKTTFLALFGLISFFPLAAADVGIFVSSFEIPAGGTLTIEFTVLYTDPANAELSSADIPPSFTPISGRKERRIIAEKSAESGQIPVTVISRQWVATEPGNFSLGPFVIDDGKEKVTLPSISVTVSRPASTERAVLRWSIPDTLIGTGKPLRIVLEGNFSGILRAVTCPVPEHAILEEISRIEAGFAGNSTWVRLASYNWTPLESGLQALPLAELEYESANGSSRTAVSDARKVSVARDTAVKSTERVPSSVRLAFSSPSSGGVGGGASGVVASNGSGGGRPSLPRSVSEIPWESGQYAVILASLRHSEYTRLFPREYRVARLACEAQLELGSSLAVPPAAWKPYAVIGAVIFFTIGFLLKLLPRVPRAFRSLSFLPFFTSALLAIFAVSLYTRDPGAAGVSRGVRLLHVPEPDSTVIEEIPEGTALVIKRRSGKWLYVRAQDSVAGWIAAEGLIEYTATER